MLALFSRAVRWLRILGVRALSYTLFRGTCTLIRRGRRVADPWSAGRSFVRYLISDWPAATRSSHSRLCESCQRGIKNRKRILAGYFNAHRSQGLPYLQNSDWPLLRYQRSQAKLWNTLGRFIVGFHRAQRFQNSFRFLEFLDSLFDKSLLFDAVGEFNRYGIHRPMVRIPERVGHALNRSPERARTQGPFSLVLRQAPTTN
jgi:hypothetical protein